MRQGPIETSLIILLTAWTLIAFINVGLLLITIKRIASSWSSDEPLQMFLIDVAGIVCNSTALFLVIRLIRELNL